ncbi:MAG: ABC transporter permease [Pseudomonadota bacterium]
MITLVKRPEPSKLAGVFAPVVALLVTFIACAILFAILDRDPWEALRVLFWDPLFDETMASFTRPQLLVKAAPIILIALGLSFGFQAGIWNIGAEGQYIMGAIAATSVGLVCYGTSFPYIFLLMGLAGIAGGVAWAMIPALLRVRFGANEILVSLMLVYVAIQFLAAMVTGPMKSPTAMGFPETRSFRDFPPAFNGELISNTGLHWGVVAALLTAIAAHAIQKHHLFGFQIRVLGLAPKAARLSGIEPTRMVVLCLALSGGLAGLAGFYEASGPTAKLTTDFPSGYGFTAIIVAFLGRLNPIGIVFAGLVLALTIIGGELAQLMLNIPAAAVLVIQGMLLFFLLAADVLVRYRFVLHPVGVG